MPYTKTHIVDFISFCFHFLKNYILYFQTIKFFKLYKIPKLSRT
jgi:hypothetical protein